MVMKIFLGGEGGNNILFSHGNSPAKDLKIPYSFPRQQTICSRPSKAPHQNSLKYLNAGLIPGGCSVVMWLLVGSLSARPFETGDESPLPEPSKIGDGLILLGEVLSLSGRCITVRPHWLIDLYNSVERCLNEQRKRREGGIFSPVI